MFFFVCLGFPWYCLFQSHPVVHVGLHSEPWRLPIWCRSWRLQAPHVSCRGISEAGDDSSFHSSWEKNIQKKTTVTVGWRPSLFGFVGPNEEMHFSMDWVMSGTSRSMQLQPTTRQCWLHQELKRSNCHALACACRDHMSRCESKRDESKPNKNLNIPLCSRFPCLHFWLCLAYQLTFDLSSLQTCVLDHEFQRE